MRWRRGLEVARQRRCVAAWQNSQTCLSVQTYGQDEHAHAGAPRGEAKRRITNTRRSHKRRSTLEGVWSQIAINRHALANAHDMQRVVSRCRASTKTNALRASSSRNHWHGLTRATSGAKALCHWSGSLRRVDRSRLVSCRWLKPRGEAQAWVRPAPQPEPGRLSAPAQSAGLLLTSKLSGPNLPGTSGEQRPSWR